MITLTSISIPSAVSSISLLRIIISISAMIILAYFVKLLKATMTYGTIRLWESANNQITELGPLFTIIALFVDLGSFPRRIKNMVSLIVL